MKMLKFFRSPTFVIFIAICICCCTAVRSEYDSSEIRLPTDATGDDAVDTNLCGGTTTTTPTPASCPVKCFRTDPVCGVNGVTYWCGCAEAMCEGTRVAKLGFCEVGNGGSASLSGQAFLLVHIVWLIVLGFSVVFGLF